MPLTVGTISRKAKHTLNTVNGYVLVGGCTASPPIQTLIAEAMQPRGISQIDSSNNSEKFPLLHMALSN